MTEFEKIYSEHFDDVYKFALVLCKNETLAEDITQETFIRALKSINKFNGECQLRVWLCQIAKNYYFSLCKKNKTQGILNESSSTFCIESLIVDKESAFEIHKILHNLGEPYKEVFNLRLFAELSFAQIGELFGKTESWARVTFHRTKIKLKEELK